MIREWFGLKILSFIKTGRCRSGFDIHRRGTFVRDRLYNLDFKGWFLYEYRIWEFSRVADSSYMLRNLSCGSREGRWLCHDPLNVSLRLRISWHVVWICKGRMDTVRGHKEWLFWYSVVESSGSVVESSSKFCGMGSWNCAVITLKLGGSLVKPSSSSDWRVEFAQNWSDHTWADRDATGSRPQKCLRGVW